MREAGGRVGGTGSQRGGRGYQKVGTTEDGRCSLVASIRKVQQLSHSECTGLKKERSQSDLDVRAVVGIERVGWSYCEFIVTTSPLVK